MSTARIRYVSCLFLAALATIALADPSPDVDAIVVEMELPVDEHDGEYDKAELEDDIAELNLVESEAKANHPETVFATDMEHQHMKDAFANATVTMLHEICATQNMNILHQLLERPDADNLKELMETYSEACENGDMKMGFSSFHTLVIHAFSMLDLEKAFHPDTFELADKYKPLEPFHKYASEAEEYKDEVCLDLSPGAASSRRGGAASGRRGAGKRGAGRRGAASGRGGGKSTTQNTTESTHPLLVEAWAAHDYHAECLQKCLCTEHGTLPFCLASSDECSSYAASSMLVSIGVSNGAHFFPDGKLSGVYGHPALHDIHEGIGQFAQMMKRVDAHLDRRKGESAQLVQEGYHGNAWQAFCDNFQGGKTFKRKRTGQELMTCNFECSSLGPRHYHGKPSCDLPLKGDVMTLNFEMDIISDDQMNPVVNVVATLKMKGVSDVLSEIASLPHVGSMMAAQGIHSNGGIIFGTGSWSFSSAIFGVGKDKHIYLPGHFIRAEVFGYFILRYDTTKPAHDPNEMVRINCDYCNYGNAKAGCHNTCDQSPYTYTGIDLLISVQVFQPWPPFPWVNVWGKKTLVSFGIELDAGPRQGSKYTRKFDGECASWAQTHQDKDGSEFQVHDFDSSGTEAQQADRCGDDCKRYDHGVGTQGFIIGVGECWCETARSATCTRLGGAWVRYDLY